MKFEFSVDEINIILQGLAELPAKHSMNIIARIQEDVAKQMQPEMKLEEGAEQPLFYNVGFVPGKSDVLGQSRNFVR